MFKKLVYAIMDAQTRDELDELSIGGMEKKFSIKWAFENGKITWQDYNKLWDLVILVEADLKSKNN